LNKKYFYFYEKIKINKTKKKMEKLNEECELIKKEIAEISSQWKTLIEKLLLKNQQLEEKKEEIEYYENEKLVEKMLETFKNIDGYALITHEEMKIIAQRVDKSNPIRKWNELKIIIKNIIKLKSKYSEWSLTSLKLIRQDNLQLMNDYEYGFQMKDEPSLLYYTPQSL
jgi:molecular chaperone GrpE (heat shock protein)